MFVQQRLMDLTARQRRLLADSLVAYNNLMFDSLSAGDSMELLFMANSLLDFNFKLKNYIPVMTDDSLKQIYDVFVYLTKNYSSLPAGLRNRFPEKTLVTLRQSIFNSLLP